MGAKVLRIVYRTIILVAIFIIALSYFSRDIKEVVFNLDNTTKMADATFPLVTIKTGENTINLLHGYSSNLDANKIRESVTPLGLDQSFEVQMDQKNYDIKKLNYEVREFVGNALIETGSVSVFEKNGDLKTAKIKLQNQLTPEKEYAVKITLISSQSEKIYFYQRIKIYEQAHLKEKLDFIMEFHNAIMDKTTAEGMIKYLEPSSNADNTSLAYVNINSSFDLVSWGNIKPKIFTDVVPAVKEIYADTASVELNYIAQAEVNGANEMYRVTEFYRVRYSSDRMYLLNYERHMDAIFDITKASVSKNELKLGITNDLDVPHVAGEDGTKIAFVRDGELWFYDLENNNITKVFSFRQNNSDYIRDIYDQHNIRIINMDAEGNMNFLVYGYMNRGQYEGKVGVILYHFVRAENRIEELVYIPIDEPYQTLKENLGELSYLNTKDVFYFNIYNTIYSYNLITRDLKEVATKVNKDQIMVFKDINYVAWQESSDPKKSKNIYIMNLDTGEQDTITAKQGYNIRLMDKIDSNMIYGYVKEGDISSTVDGSIMAPLSSVEIADVNKQILYSYSQPDFYVSGLDVADNIVNLRLVQKINENGRTMYSFAKQDQIMNKVKEKDQLISVTSRVTDQALTEYYLALPEGFAMGKLPKVQTTVSTVISQDPTVRLPEPEQLLLCYYPYITGGVAGAYENAADAIAVAKENIGVVLNSNNQIIWERGIKATSNTISEFNNMTLAATPSSTVEGCLKLMLAYQGVNVTTQQLSIQSTSAYDVLKKYSKYTPVRLTGVTLDDVLYYISEGRSVIAMTDMNNAVIIYGYDTFNIMVINPATGMASKMGIQDSTLLFENAGNVFLSYLED
ncbi:MAG TPA: hypothetical protein VN258_09395 [Mobilitalea sp.]|nr:hypothetical protein [Mobilitalea sp.]